MFEALEKQPADFSARYKDAKGEYREQYLLPHHELTVLLTGYSIPLRSKVLKWERGKFFLHLF